MTPESTDQHSWTTLKEKSESSVVRTVEEEAKEAGAAR